jgi:hypothetical protein
MLVTRITCPHCGAALKSPAGVESGKTIICPKCKERFTVSAPSSPKKPASDHTEEQDREDRVQAKRSPARVTKPARHDVEDEDEQEDDAPPARSKGTARAARAYDEDDLDDERPARRRKGRLRERKTPVGLVVGLIIGGVVVLAGVGVGLHFLLRKPAATEVSGGPNPRTPEPAPPKSDNEGKIIGRWQCTDAGGVVPPGVDMTVEFRPRGKFVMTLKGPGLEQSITADYVLAVGETVTFSNFSIAMANGQKTANDQVTIKGDEMTMREPDGRVMKFRRATQPPPDRTPPATGDLVVRPVPLSPELQRELAGVIWAPDGRSFYCLAASGKVVRHSSDDLKELKQLDLKEQCGRFALSAEGLVVPLVGSKQVVVVDPETLTEKRRIPASGLLLSSPALSIAFCSTKTGVAVIDLVNGNIAREHPHDNFGEMIDLARAAISPDGKYLFNIGNRAVLSRFAINGTDLKLQETTKFSSPEAGLVAISPDSKFVCLPGSEGPEKNLPDFPRERSAMYVFPIDNLARPAFTIDPGRYPMTVGFDVKRGRVYVPGREDRLIVFSTTGERLAEHRLGRPTDFCYYYTHPEGGRLLVACPSLFDVQLPAK